MKSIIFAFLILSIKINVADQKNSSIDYSMDIPTGLR